MAAFAALTEAVGGAQTAGERHLAFGTATRMLAEAQPPAFMELMALLAVAGPTRPHALEALAAAALAQGRPAEARRASEALVAYGGEHAVYGHALRVRAAVAQGDRTAAEASAAAVRAAWPGELAAEAVGALVAEAFPATAADVARAEAVRNPVQAAVEVAPQVFRLLPASPNPTRGVAVIPFEVPEAARVEAVLYDALGRRVAVLADRAYAAGHHAVPVDGGTLPAGAYLLRATFRPENGGPSREAVQRLTLLR